MIPTLIIGLIGAIIVARARPRVVPAPVRIRPSDPRAQVRRR